MTLMFQEPPLSRYDLNFTIAGTPVRVHPLFWLMTILLGGISASILRLAGWIPAVFLSILVHELGHALSMRRFGQPSRIVLHLMGGLTIPEPSRWGGRWANVALSPVQEVLVSLGGPAAGFLFAISVLAAVSVAGGIVATTPFFGVIPFPTAILPSAGTFINILLGALIWVNVFWGMVNLLPVFPLDGGSIARRLFVINDRWAGVRKSLWVSAIVGGLAALAGLVLLNSIYLAFLFGILAIQSYQALRGYTDAGY